MDAVGSTTKPIYIDTDGAAKPIQREILTILDIYPVGSVYLSLNASFDPNTSFGGTWERFGAGRCLWGVGEDNSGLGEKLAASLPNIKGGFRFDVSDNNLGTEVDQKFEGVVWGEYGSFGGKTNPSKLEGFSDGRIQFDNSRILRSETIQVKDEAYFDASASSSIYQDGGQVRPKSIGVIFWKRTA